ncbi:MAG: AI-2E family transporter [Alphaproteobacteria bacterium]|nr:AI-2E family transporter [Alphaproteobacteria bacterium]
MTGQERTVWWGIGLAVFGALIWLLNDILLPFVAGMAVAYLLDPLVDRLEHRIGRTAGTVVVLLGFIVVILSILFTFLPLIQAQVSRLAEVLPQVLTLIADRIEPYLADLRARIAEGGGPQLKELVQGSTNVVAWIIGVVKRIVTESAAIANLVSLMLITPIVAFYLLRDWDKLVAGIEKRLPLVQRDMIVLMMRDVDRTLAGFVRGQTMVCLILAVFYSAGLALTGLEFGLVIGLLAGLISFIPFIGAGIGGLLSVGLGLVQFDTLVDVLPVLAVFVVGQMVEGNFLTPKLVGDRVGLHPVWVIFALLAGGSLFGFLGVLLAVPVGAVVGVLVRYGLLTYEKSAFYRHGHPFPDIDLDVEKDQGTQSETQSEAQSAEGAEKK